MWSNLHVSVGGLCLIELLSGAICKNKQNIRVNLLYVVSELTPKGPRPFFCEKTLKTAISIAKSKKIW